MPLINDLVCDGYLKTPKIIRAFKKIKRQDFILPAHLAEAEIDAPLPIGHGQTISQPATVAFMLEKLKPKSGDKILDVGAGSGWTSALLASIVGDQGKVYGLERISELASFARNNIDKYNFIKNGLVEIHWLDGYKGLPQAAPFDKILVSAAAEKIPKALLEQLKTGGRLVMPLGQSHELQTIVAVQKTDTAELAIKEYPGFVFVPLVKD